MSATTVQRKGFMGAFLGSDEAMAKFHAALRKRIDKEKREDDIISQFRTLINTDPVVRMYITEMIKQIPPNPIYDDHRVKDIEDLLSLLNAVLRQAPEFNDTLLVGTPLSALIIWTMGTSAGFAAYRNEKINGMFKQILDRWSQFLDSRASLSVLNTGKNGWMCDAAREKLNMNDYVYNPDAPHWGFRSWNDFFTRSLAPGARPMKKEDEIDPKVVVSACDSTIYNIAHHVKKHSEFWIKEQPYSLEDILGDLRQYAGKFEGGSVYQAFLNPFNYHRWHSPVDGIVKEAHIQEGLYFSQTDCMGEDPNDQDASEGYISQVQTRAIFIIETKEIGLVAVVPIGMVEISTCILNDNMVRGASVKKGDELGHFQFGGSTHCLIFQKGIIGKFDKEDQFFKEHDKQIFVKVGQRIAKAE